MKKILFSVLFALVVAPSAFAGGGEAVSTPEMSAIMPPVEASCYEKYAPVLCDFENLIKNLEGDIAGMEEDVSALDVDTSTEEVRILSEIFIADPYAYRPYATLEVKRAVRMAKKMDMDAAKVETLVNRFLTAKKEFLAKKSSLGLLLPAEKDTLASIEKSENSVKESMENISSFSVDFAYDLTSNEMNIVKRTMKLANRYEKKFQTVVKEARSKISGGEMMKSNPDMWLITSPVDNMMWKIQSAESNIENVILGTHPVATPLR